MGCTAHAARCSFFQFAPQTFDLLSPRAGHVQTTENIRESTVAFVAKPLKRIRSLTGYYQELYIIYISNVPTLPSATHQHPSEQDKPKKPIVTELRIDFGQTEESAIDTAVSHTHTHGQHLGCDRLFTGNARWVRQQNRGKISVLRHWN